MNYKNKRLLSEGTISWLFGFHNICHSFYVYLAWIKLYKKVPTLKESFCIFIHDIGYCGMNYLTDKNHNGHELLGAKIAGKLFGEKYYFLCLNHRKFNAKLEIPDEHSHLLLPFWILRIQHKIENPKNKHKNLMQPEAWIEYNKKRFKQRKKGLILKGQFNDIFKAKKEFKG